MLCCICRVQDVELASQQDACAWGTQLPKWRPFLILLARCSRKAPHFLYYWYSRSYNFAAAPLRSGLIFLGKELSRALLPRPQWEAAGPMTQGFSAWQCTGSP